MGMVASCRVVWHTPSLITLAALALSPAIAFAKIWYRGDINYTEPRKELARETTELWHKQTSSRLQYVGGGQRYEDAVAFYSPDNPHVFIHLDYHRAPWVSADDLKRAGLLVVCSAEDKQCLQFGGEHLHTADSSDRLEPLPFLLGLYRRAFEFHRDNCAAA